MRRTKTAVGSTDSKTRPGYSKKSLLQSTKKRLIAIGRLTKSPAFNVSILVALILGVFGGIRLLRARQAPAQLSFVESRSDDPISSGNNDLSSSTAAEIFSGEVYATTIRLRETAGLGIAISLAVFAEYNEKRKSPSTFREILTSIASRNLTPPAIIIGKNEISSPTSTLLVHYQSVPLRFEILSRPKPGIRGPALMLRFPLAAKNGQTVSYFQSSIARPDEILAPFATADQIGAAGWTLEQWRGELMPLDKGVMTALSEERSLWKKPNQKH